MTPVRWDSHRVEGSCSKSTLKNNIKSTEYCPSIKRLSSPHATSSYRQSMVVVLCHSTTLYAGYGAYGIARCNTIGGKHWRRLWGGQYQWAIAVIETRMYRCIAASKLDKTSRVWWLQRLCEEVGWCGQTFIYGSFFGDKRWEWREYQLMRWVV